MGFDPISIDQLVQHCGLTAEEVSSMLLIMELEGRVAALPGGFYQRLKPRE
jgi:DNA processing protein